MQRARRTSAAEHREIEMNSNAIRGVAFVGFLVVFNVLSYVFHWGWIIY
jgi:hypothetical protein